MNYEATVFGQYAVFYNPLPVVLYAPHHENTPVIVLPDNEMAEVNGKKRKKG
jgi:hypothetical protein